MPWNESTRMDERCRFVVTYLSGHFTMSQLCQSFRISRPTGYKWVGRYGEHGPAGLVDHSRAPHRCPHRMSDEVAQWLLCERRAHPQWGPRKLLVRYRRAFPYRTRPSRTAVAALLRRAGLSQARKRRRPTSRYGTGVVRVYHPNELWTIDFKGQFRTGDHRWCYPLTVMDAASRYLLACQGQYAPRAAPVREHLERVFREHGLPRAMHCDNGTPFASVGIGGLSRLSVQWLKLGIRLQRSRAGCPQDNGAHERMHRTLKAQATRPPAAHLRAQQRRFEQFRAEYNHERPHEALADRTPAQLYRPSTRRYPSRLEPPHYPGHFELRRVSDTGCLKWQGEFLFVGRALSGELLGLEEIDDGLWSVHFAHQLLARFNARTRKLIGVPV